ncbi:MAG: acyltransferase [Aeriscardovia sp.]|nr:acyltransferase [Aeriscardovia sp.]
MNAIQYWAMKVRYRLAGRKKEIVSDYFRKMGMTIGKGCNICDNITTTQAYLITLGDNVTLAGGVLFVGHDNSVSKMIPNTTDLFGRITIGDNCFVGNRAIIMYGVTLAPNIVVAAGSVVTRSFDTPGIIIGGNPARQIGTWEDFIERNKEKAFNLDEIPASEQQAAIEHSPKLVERPPKR